MRPILDQDDLQDRVVVPRGPRRPLRERTIAVLPTLFTLGNLLCGFGAIFIASRDPGVALAWDWTPLTFAAVLIFVGMAFDGLDGHIARMARATSDLGEQLDSMADMVTFGVAPAFLAVQLVGVAVPFVAEADDTLWDRTVLVFAGIYVACAALRLARFNVEVAGPSESAHMAFNGLPSPGAAGTVASVILLHESFLARRPPDHWSMPLTTVGMVLLMVLVAWAMVSRLHYSHVVNRYLRGRMRFSTFAGIVVLLLLMTIHLQATLAVGFGLYALSAPVSWLSRRTWRTLRR